MQTLLLPRAKSLKKITVNLVGEKKEIQSVEKQEASQEPQGPEGRKEPSPEKPRAAWMPPNWNLGRSAGSKTVGWKVACNQPPIRHLENSKSRRAGRDGTTDFYK